MNTCRDIRKYFQEGRSELQPTELSRHLRDCPDCAREHHLVRVERQLLQATLPKEEAVELSSDFWAKLAARLRGTPPGDKWAFLELAWSFFKPFAVVALVWVVFVGGLTLYADLTEPNLRLPLESYLVEPPADDVSLILSEDVALTQERVLRTLVVVKEEDYGNRR